MDCFYVLPSELWIYISNFLDEGYIDLFFTSKDFFSLLIHCKPTVNAIKYAVATGNIGIVRYINKLKLDKDPIVDYPVFLNIGLNQCLKIACKHNQLLMIQYLIDCGADINQNNCKILGQAINKDCLPVVKILIDNGAKIKKIYSKCLIKLCRNGKLDMTKYLVSLYPSLKILLKTNDRTIHDALVTACQYGQKEIAVVLVENGASVAIYSHQPFICACRNGNLELVIYLVNHGASIFAEKCRCVQVAAESGHLEIVKYLVSLGVNIHRNSNEAIRMARLYGHNEVVDYLLSIGGRFSNYE